MHAHPSIQPLFHILVQAHKHTYWHLPYTCVHVYIITYTSQVHILRHKGTKRVGTRKPSFSAHTHLGYTHMHTVTHACTPPPFPVPQPSAEGDGACGHAQTFSQYTHNPTYIYSCMTVCSTVCVHSEYVDFTHPSSHVAVPHPAAEGDGACRHREVRQAL